MSEKIDIEIIIFESLQQLSKYLEQNVPEWVIGVCYDRNKILLVLNDETKHNITKVFIHEYVHFLVKLKFKGECPQWINEGLAVFMADQINIKDAVEIKVDYDYYNSTWDSKNFYEQSVYMMIAIMNKYGVSEIISHLIDCTDFMGDQYIGIESLRKMGKELQ